MAVTTAQRTPAIAGVAYAGFWIRVLAFLVDGLAIGVIVSLLTLGRGGIAVYDQWLELVAWRNFVETAASFAYFTVLWSWIGGGQTLGMRLFGLHVVGADGQPISIVAAIVRWVGIVISAAMLLLGLVWVAFDPRKQGWHDKFAGSFVVHAGGRTDAVERMPDVGRGTPHPAARGLTVALGLLGAGLGLTGAYLAFAGDAVIQPGNTLTVMTAFAAIALAGSLLAWRLPSITFVVLALAVVGYWIVLGPLVGTWYNGLLAATAAGPVAENQYWFDAPATALFTASAILLAMGSLAALCGVDWSGGRDEVQA